MPTPPACPKGQFHCGKGEQCIDEKKVCDGHVDCKNSADETQSCSKFSCLSFSGAIIGVSL